MFLGRDFRRISRGLRFRLTATYALFFTVPLIAVMGLFRANLADSLDKQAHSVLNERWAALKAALRIEKNTDTGKNAAYWYYDDKDPDESRIVLAIKSVYLITDADGNPLQEPIANQPSVSATYREIGIDRPDEIRRKMKAGQQAAAKPNNPESMAFWDYRSAPDGTPYLIRSGIALDEGHMEGGRRLPYYVAIGISLRNYKNILRDTTWRYLAVIPGALILASFLGWVMSGRALSPVRAVAQTAQRISGSNLSLRIPARGAGDELDYLILTFNRMIERLEASFRQMKQFSTDVSHELRTPITAIRGQLEVALFTAQTTEQYREAMFNALQDIDRLSQIVRALLLLSQAESGQLALQKSRLDLCQMVRDLVEQFEIPAEAAGVALATDLPPECPAVVDRVQIERMISNLLSNALKFTPEGGHVKVTVRNPENQGEDGGPDYIRIVVEDTGRGIAAEHLPHIFDRFYRVPGPGNAPSPEQGLGLGLSFVAWIVKAHRGKIDVESKPGEGARFLIRLPAPGMGSDTIELARREIRA